MKPTSIIFLIFSIILIFGGVSLCSIAEDVAAAKETPLFMQEQTEDGDLITKFVIDEEEITKIVVSVNDANVCVVTGAAESYVELVNFPINTFTNSISNGVLSVDDNTDLLTLFNLSGKGTQFHGLRHYLNTANFNPGKKAVNIYLTDHISLQEMELTAMRADITLDDCHNCLSYKLTADHGDVNLIHVVDSDLAKITITGEGNALIENSAIAEIQADIVKGNCSFIAQQTNIQSYTLETKLGNIYIDGDIKGSVYNSTSAVTMVNCIFNIEEGNIFISELK